MSNSKPGLDWDALRARLAEAARLTEGIDASTADGAILAARARRLAQKPRVEGADGQMLDLLCFELGTERYALENRFVREVAKFPEPEPVPGTPDFVLGVANLRGDLLMVIDLAGALGLAVADRRRRPRAIVCGEARSEVCIAIDTVPEVLVIPARSVDPVGRSADGLDTGMVLGMTADGRVLLDGAALLSNPRLFVGRRGA